MKWATSIHRCRHIHTARGCIASRVTASPFPSNSLPHVYFPCLSSSFLSLSSPLFRTPVSPFSSSAFSSSSSPPSSVPPSSHSLSQWHSFNSSGLHYLSLGDYSSALSLFVSAMRDPAAQAVRGPYTWLSLANAGIANREEGRVEEGEKRLRDSARALRAMRKEVLDAGKEEKHINQRLYQSLGHVLRQWGIALELMNNVDEAEQVYKESKDNYERYMQSKEYAADNPSQQKEIKKEHSGTAFAIATCEQMRVEKEGNKEKREEMIKRAQQSYDDSLSLAQQVYDADSLNIAVLYETIAAFLLKHTEQKEVAQTHLLNAIDIYKQHKHPQIKETLKQYLSTLIDNKEEVNKMVESFMQTKPKQ